MNAEKNLHASAWTVVLIAVKVSVGVQGKGFGDVFFKCDETAWS